MNRFIGATVVIPIILSLIVVILMVNGVLSDPILDIRVNEVWIVVLAGILISGLIAVNIYSQNWLRQLHRRNMEAARTETAEEHRRFLNRLDHELKNPLTAIRAGLANLTDTADPKMREQIITNIDAQTTRLSHLVTDLRKVADISTRPIERVPVLLEDLLHEVHSLALEDQLASARQLVLTVPATSLPPVIGDPDLILLALLNLVKNALKFTHPGDRIEFRAMAKDHLVVIEVSDTGPGIPPEEQPHVWEELYRGRTAQGVPGSGIGLSLVQSIVEQHQGHIHLRSTPGYGTTFSIMLPVRNSEKSDRHNAVKRL